MQPRDHVMRRGSRSKQHQTRAPATTCEASDFIRVSGYREQYAAIHSEARVDRLTFLSNLHVTAKQLGDERARFLSFNTFRECRVETAHGLAIELRALRDSQR